MKSPAFRFYADDFVAGTVDLSQAEVGAYIRLLCHQWNRGAIPWEVEKLERLAGGPVSTDVLAKFPAWEDGMRRNRRLEEERAKQTEYAERQTEKGRAGARARWNGANRNRSTDGTGIAPAISRPMPEQRPDDGLPFPLPLPSPSPLPDPSPNPSHTGACAHGARAHGDPVNGGGDGIGTDLPPAFPRTVEEAVRRRPDGCSELKAEQEWHLARARGGAGAKGDPITNWTAFLSWAVGAEERRIESEASRPRYGHRAPLPKTPDDAGF